MYGWLIVCPCPIGRGRSAYAASRCSAGTKRWRGTRRSAVKTRSSWMPRASIWLRTISSRASLQAASARGPSVGAGAAAQVKARKAPAIASASLIRAILSDGSSALTRRARDSFLSLWLGAPRIRAGDAGRQASRARTRRGLRLGLPWRKWTGLVLNRVAIRESAETGVVQADPGRGVPEPAAPSAVGAARAAACAGGAFDRLEAVRRGELDLCLGEIGRSGDRGARRVFHDPVRSTSRGTP